jgi:large subunit ribosomal protein L22
MQVKASLNKYRRSAKKMREITPIVKGLKVTDAISQLDNSAKAGAVDVSKLLRSAVADAKNKNLDESNLIVREFQANEKPTMKRWRARAYGRAAQILKRTCVVEIVLDEIEKTSKDYTKEIKDIKKQEKDLDKKEKKKTKTKVKKDKSDKHFDQKDSKMNQQGQSKGGAKIFRRKSF